MKQRNEEIVKMKKLVIAEKPSVGRDARKKAMDIWKEKIT